MRSVASQSVAAEHLVIDGQSTDSTLKIVQEFSRSELRIVSEKDQGMYDALNKGIRLATGDVIGILHADDFYAADDTLQKVSDLFDSTQVETCFGDLDYVDQEQTDRVVRHWKSGSFTGRNFYWGWMPPHPTFFVRREVYERLGGFRLDMGTAADYELMLRFLQKAGVSSGYLPEVLIKMRTGGQSNLSVEARMKANQMDRKAWDVNDLKPYPWSLAIKPVRKIGQWISPYLRRTR